MNKKVKSLLIAGLLVVGMSGNVFADDVHVNDALIVENIKLDEVFIFQDNNVFLELDGPSNILLADIKAAWVENYNITYVKLILKDGSEVNVPMEKINVENNGSGLIRNSVDLDDLDDPLGASDVKTVKIGIDYKYPQDEDGNGVPDFKDDEPVDPPVEEEPEINDPNTGDAGMMVGAITVAAASIGLFVVNKKKDEE